jgi:hypothetical protein
MWNPFHRHFRSGNYTVEDNPNIRLRDRYPVIRTCACGKRQLMQSAWKHTFSSSKDGETASITITTPETWYDLTIAEFQALLAARQIN